MKNLFVFAAILFLGMASSQAATVVFVDNTGVYVEQTDLSCAEIYANAANSSYDGEVSCWEFNLNQSGTPNINGTALPSVSVKEKMTPTLGTPPQEDECLNPYLVYNSPKGVQMVRVSEKSDMKRLLKVFSGDSCGSPQKAELLWTYPPSGKGGRLLVNGKGIDIPTATVSVDLYGEILISGDPIEYDED